MVPASCVGYPNQSVPAGEDEQRGEVTLPALPGVTHTALAHRTFQTSGSLLYKSLTAS